jgi:predicted RNA-binding protein with RPS1 domain
VKVRVLEVNEALKRISLTMKSAARPAKPSNRDKKAPVTQKKPVPVEKKASSIQDLMSKFNASR